MKTSTKDLDLASAKFPKDIISEYQNTPIEALFQYHNLGVARRPYRKADLLIGMCMDHRISLRIPQKFAYILQVGGVQLETLDFHIAYSIALGGVKAIALIAHDDCGMASVQESRSNFVRGLADRAGWDASSAGAYFDRMAPRFDTGDSLQFIWAEARRIRALFPEILVAPLFYRVRDGSLLQIVEKKSTEEGRPES